MREKQLSRRLQAVVGLVTPGRRVADVGCDHAYVSIYLMEHGLAEECIALDVREGPLQRARQNIETHRLSGRIQTRLGSGLLPLRSGEVDTVLMAGMGGILVRDLLEESRELSHSLKEWVLQPQSDVDLVRRYIRKSGFRIVAEEMVEETGKYYPMFRAVSAEDGKVEAATKKEMECSETDGTKTINETEEPGGSEPAQGESSDFAVWDRFGKLLLQQKHPVLYEYLKERERHYDQVIRQMQEGRATQKNDASGITGASIAEQEIVQQKEIAEINVTVRQGTIRERQFLEIKQEAEYVKRALQYWGSGSGQPGTVADWKSKGEDKR